MATHSFHFLPYSEIKLEIRRSESFVIPNS